MSNNIIPIRVSVADGWPADVLRYQRDLIDPSIPDYLIIGPEVSHERLRRGCAMLGLDPEGIILDMANQPATQAGAPEEASPC